MAKPETENRNAFSLATIHEKTRSGNHNTDSVFAKIAREAYVIGGGLAHGLVNSSTIEQLGASTPELAGSMLFGNALPALAQGKRGLISLGAKITGGALGATSIKTLSDDQRLAIRIPYH